MHNTSNIILPTLTLLLIDQTSKRAFVDQGRWSAWFVPVYNTGAARSLPIPEWIIAFVALSASLWIIILYRKNEVQTLTMTLFLAGIWGNIADRIFYPGVRDFITISDRFPIFNIADIYITSAVILMIYYHYIHTQTNTISNQK